MLASNNTFPSVLLAEQAAAPSAPAAGKQRQYLDSTTHKMRRVDSSGAVVQAAEVVETVNTVATSGAAQTVPDVTSATVSRITLTANCTLTFPTAVAGKSFTLVLVQDATGTRTVTWPGTVKWAGGTAPTLTTTASKTDVLTFLCADGTNWFGFLAGLNF
ncbi:MAG: hypothetical protein ACXV5Q_00645 [Frankiaceae bacterium]